MIKPGSCPPVGVTLYTLILFSGRDMTSAAPLLHTTLLAQHLWCVFGHQRRGMDMLGPGTGREGTAPMGTETTTLVLKALNNSALSRVLLVASDRDTIQTS